MGTCCATWPFAKRVIPPPTHLLQCCHLQHLSSPTPWVLLSLQEAKSLQAAFPTWRVGVRCNLASCLEQLWHGRALGSRSPPLKAPVLWRDEPQSPGGINPTLHFLLVDLCYAQIMNGDSVLPNQKKINQMQQHLSWSYSKYQ